MDKLTEIFNSSLQTGYVDKSVLSSIEYQPELLVNQKNPPKKVLTTIIHELENCSQFYISVAFVTTSGVATIINKLLELEGKGIKGQILVSQYLNFTQPEALKRLAKFQNIDLRIATTGNAHAKGYIFKSKSHFNIIIGSSNLTAQALSTNKEWNIKVSALDQSGLVDKILNEFQVDFQKGTPVTEDYLREYEVIYHKQLLINPRNQVEIYADSPAVISPNSMQQVALKNLEVLRAKNKNKALIISATGTGKTYLSAFDAKNFNPKRLLFVVHRKIIAEDALKTFQNVFGQDRTMGIFSGEQRELNCDFVFSTVQTISKPEHLESFAKTDFDYIVIDETHRSGAQSYLRLLEYFEPRFLLGMTATPERTDGNDIFQLFDHNIAYEIRLNKAMEEDMLSSFHYYGVTDLYIDNEEVEDRTDFNRLVSNERVNRILEQVNFYGTDNGITRGLIFCSRKEEAKELSTLFNKQGLKTIALTGDSTDDERTIAIQSLESHSLREKLDYIFTVDIFNEGIDIPTINQIIMLRPTASAIIFIQQLGRGLRKVDGKGYLTVIDFIGNYENNYLIPVALYGDTSYNKDSLRKLLTDGSRMIPGASTINFDEITRDRIFKSIDSANMQEMVDLKKDYNLLKFKLGRIPMMMDFIEHGSRDPFLYVDKSGSYLNFVLKVEKEFLGNFSKKESKLLELFSIEINNSKRLEESLIIKLLVERGKLFVSDLREYVLSNYGYQISNETIESCIVNLNFEFIREKKDGKLVSARNIYDLNILKIESDEFIFSEEFLSFLRNETFKTFLKDSAEYSVSQFTKAFELDKWDKGFVLYRKYSRKDVFRILNVAENPVAQNVGGYLVSPDNAHCPIFVNYHKEDDISESTKYEDEFVNNREFNWMSKSNRSLKSNDVQSILGKKGPIRLPLFIKKNNDEGTDFYYMGEVRPELNQVEETSMKNDKGGSVSVVRIRFAMINPVSSALYNYLQAEVKVKDDKSSKPTKEIPIQGAFDFEQELKNPIPLFDFYAAAGSFSEMQSNKEFVLIEGPSNISTTEGYFACKIVGESMNRSIPNGSICLFKKYNGGSRDGKIVLVENIDVQDQDFNSAFTIKTYSSEKDSSSESSRNVRVSLRPNSTDPNYKDLVFDEESGSGLRVVGIFVQVLR